MIDVRPILALIESPNRRPHRDSPVSEWQIEEAIVEIVKATNAELERIVRELFERFGRDVTAQDIAAVLGKPVEVCDGTIRAAGGGRCGFQYGCGRPGCPVTR